MSQQIPVVVTDNYIMKLEYVQGMGWFMHFDIKKFNKTTLRETFREFEKFKSTLKDNGICELFGEVMVGDDKHTKFVLMYGGEPFMDNYIDGKIRSTIYRWGF